MDVMCIEWDYFCCVIEIVIKVGVIMINILDIVGYIVFVEFVDLIKCLIEIVSGVDEVIFVIYCYNDFGMVIVNFLVVVVGGVC